MGKTLVCLSQDGVLGCTVSPHSFPGRLTCRGRGDTDLLDRPGRGLAVPTRRSWWPGAGQHVSEADVVMAGVL